MNREQSWQRIDATETFDLVVVGGGATGLSIALDASVRGLSVALFERSDFGKGTSTRSTKLVHGGVRYLRQGRLGLVREALRERELLRQHAPHIVDSRPFAVPARSWFDKSALRLGLGLYDVLGGASGYGRSRGVSRQELERSLPTLSGTRCRHGGVVYHDGVFDDGRLLAALARTASSQGAAIVNYATVVALEGQDRIRGAVVVDSETGRERTVAARCVINATGVFVDELRSMDRPDVAPLVAPSQGIHLVVDREFLPGETAIVVPRTDDGRVLFLVPWADRVLVGTTDTAIPQATAEPRALEEEIEFVLSAANSYLETAIDRSDVRSVFAGIRPLVSKGSTGTAALSRDHTIEVSSRGLLTITGGKWTTCRRMAEDGVDRALEVMGESPRPVHMTPLIGSERTTSGPLAAYGGEAARVVEAGSTARIHASLAVSEAQVVWAAREEMARSVEDVLARRTPALHSHAEAAAEAAGRVAELLAVELGRDAAWVREQVSAFATLAQGYRL